MTFVVHHVQLLSVRVTIFSIGGKFSPVSNFTDLHTLTLAARSSCTLGRGEATCNFSATCTCLYYNTRIQHITIHSYMYLCVLCITIHGFSALQLPKAVTKTLHMSGIFVALLLISSCYDKCISA